VRGKLIFFKKNLLKEVFWEKNNVRTWIRVCIRTPTPCWRSWMRCLRRAVRRESSRWQSPCCQDKRSMC